MNVLDKVTITEAFARGKYGIIHEIDTEKELPYRVYVPSMGEYFQCREGEFVPLDPALVTELRGCTVSTAETRYKLGDHVHVIGGAFTGIKGQICQVITEPLEDYVVRDASGRWSVHAENLLPMGVTVVDEIERLRAENAELQARVRRFQVSSVELIHNQNIADEQIAALTAIAEKDCPPKANPQAENK